MRSSGAPRTYETLNIASRVPEVGGRSSTVTPSGAFAMSVFDSRDRDLRSQIPICGKHGRYWARTSDPQLVELVLSQLS
jgi:hypothetical protein